MLEPARAAVTRANVQGAIARLEERLRGPAGDPESPWALAHGLLAFGKDFETRDGRSAVLVAASFAERRPVEGGSKARYGFAVERNGKPVEPHPHLLVKTFLEVGVDPELALRAADGQTITVRRLIEDMRSSLNEPKTDAQWQNAAWWLSALELDAASRAHASRFREAALARLEADDAVLAAEAADPFAADAPMGAAKRNKTHIYGHPCGGLHFVQAVLRSASGSTELEGRAARQARLLLRRYEAERALYAKTLESHPQARLLVSGQQLKFFGHLLETLSLVVELGLASDDPVLADAIVKARRSAASDLLATLGQLESERAYEQLAELSAQRPQLALDLVGDGCHALHGLRKTLDVLP